MYSDQGANNFFEWLHDSDTEDSWDDGELLTQSPGQQPLQSSVLSWLASKSKLREQKKTEHLGAKISSHYQEMNDPNEMSTLFVYPSPSGNNESSGLIETRNDAEFEGSDLMIHTVDGDVMDYLREFRTEEQEFIQTEEQEVIKGGEQEVISDNGDMAQSSLQVRYLPCLDL